MGAKRGTLEDRFWRYVSPEPNTGCWLWAGAGSSENGYGRMWSSEKSETVLAHRVSYIIAHGEIPDGLELDHKCRMPCCVNPEHLEPVTHAVNMERGIHFDFAAEQRNRTECPQGHPYSEENTYRHLHKTGYWKRYCKECLRAKDRARRKWQREERASAR